MIDINTKVKVKLREPVGSPTTWQTNVYLEPYSDLTGTVYMVEDRGSRKWYYVWFDNHSQKMYGTFEAHELEVVE